MRIKGKKLLNKDKSGKVDLIIDSDEDLWALYNIIGVGDAIKTKMSRKIQHEILGGGKRDNKKINLILTIKVEEIDYSQEDSIIRIKGKNITENEYISIGQYQTVEISINSFFTLYKTFWDEIHLETLKNATDLVKNSELSAIIMEEGIAHLYFISNNQTILKGKVEISIPKKRNGTSKHDQGKVNFFEKIFNNLLKQINFESIKCVIIASPGFYKDEYKKFMEEKLNVNSKEYQNIKLNLNKFIYTHSSGGYKQSLEEILSKPEIKKLITNTKFINDNEIIEEFHKILGTDMDKCFFGLKSFELVYEKNAIDTVIYTDGFLRKIPPLIRKNLSPKLSTLKNNLIKVYQFSSQHTSGEEIDHFGGIVGIMTYVVEEVQNINADDLEIEDKKVNDEEKYDQQLIDIINDNSENYNVENLENIEDQKKEEKDLNKDKENLGVKVEKKGKKNKNANNNIKIKQIRKKSSWDDEDED